MEITLVLVTILIIFAYGAGIYELGKQLRTLETETPAAPAHDVTTPEEKPPYIE